MMQVIVSDQRLRNTDGMMIGQKARVVNYGGTQMPVGDGDLGVFDLLLQQLAAMPGGEADSLIQQFQQLQDEEEEEGTDLAMQMLAEMLGDNPAMQSILQDMAEQNPELVEQLQDMAKGGTLGNWLSAASEKAQQGAQAATASDPSAKAAQTAGEAQQDGSDRISVETPNAAGSEAENAKDSAGDLLNGQSQFNNNVQAAKKMLKARGASSENTNYTLVDVEKLQQHADTARAEAAAKTSSPLPEPNTKEIIDQFSKGFHENVSQGKNEFVVKLKPAGLGEITVKLVEGADKISMSIMTSSTQVAKLLSGELGLLRENLKPYNVEVHEVVSQTQNASDALGAGSNEQFNQAFAHQQGQQQYNEQAPQYYYYNQDSSEMDSPFPEEMLQMTPNSGLNAYI